MTIQAAYYSTFAVDSLLGVHAKSSNPVYKLAFMKPAFRYNRLNTRWRDIDWREISPSGKPALEPKEIPYPKGGYVVEMVATMVDGKFRFYPRNQSSITTLINYGIQSGWSFKTLVLYESKSGSLVFAFNALETITGDYGGRFLKPRYTESKEVWNAGPPIVSSDLPPNIGGSIDFLRDLALPPYVYDGEVRGIIPGNNNSYFLAGTFTKLAEGRYAGRGAFDLVDSETGLKRPERFKVSGGSVYSIIQNGEGGLFILGDFTAPKKSICKYSAGFEVDSTWKINSNIVGTILTGDIDDKFLYVGGKFKINQGGTNYINLVRFDLETGELDILWNPKPSNQVRVLKIHNEISGGDLGSASNKILYLGGDFVSISSLSSSTSSYTLYQKKYIARLNLGELDDPPMLDLEWGPTLNGSVHTIETNEMHVYAGGSFTVASSMSRRRILRSFHTTNFYLGLDTSWSANWGDHFQSSQNFIQSIALYEDYIFASARSSNNSDRHGSIRTLGAFSTKNSSVLNFFPDFQNGTESSQVLNMSIFGKTLYCVGSFQTVNGESRPGSVSFDLSGQTITILPWSVKTNKSGPTGAGDVCLFPTTAGIFLGGKDLSPISFRSGLCKINEDGKIDPWNPSGLMSSKFNCIERHEGFIYAGSERLVRISETTGLLSHTWPGGLSSASITKNVLALKVFENKLYVGSDGLIGGQRYFARFSLSNSITQDSWNPNIELISSQGASSNAGFVNSIGVSSEKVFLTGKFTKSGGVEREGFAVLRHDTGATLPILCDLELPLSGDGLSERYPIIADNEGAYIAGSFTSAKRGSSVILTGIEQNNFSILNNLCANGSVTSIIPDGSGGFFIGGTFTKILGEKRNRIAHVKQGLNLSSWAPNINGQINKIYKYENYLYVVGSFTQINGISRLRSARFIIQSDGIELDSSYITNFLGGNCQVRAVGSDGTWVYYGLDDSYFNSSSRRFVKLNGFSLNSHRGLVRVSASTGQIDNSWACKINLSISSHYRQIGFIQDICLNPQNNKIYVCGRYSHAFDSTGSGGISYGNASCFSTLSGASIIHPWTVSIPIHPLRNIDYHRVNNRTPQLRLSSSKGISRFKTLNSIKIHNDYVYVAGSPFLWGSGQSIHRSSRVARFPIDQNSSNFGLADTSFKVANQGDDQIVSLVSVVEHSENYGTSLEFDSSGDIHFSSLNTNIATFNSSTKRFSYQPFNGYLKLDGQTGEIKHFLSQMTSYPIYTTAIVGNNLMVFASLSNSAWDLLSSVIFVGNNGSFSPVFSKSHFGTKDSKMSIYKDGRWLYVISNNQLDTDSSKDKYFRVADLNGVDTLLNKEKMLVVSAPSRAKTITKVGNFIVIAGGEMTRDPLALNDTAWGDFIDHGFSNGRKVVYYKITETP